MKSNSVNIVIAIQSAVFHWELKCSGKVKLITTLEVSVIFYMVLSISKHHSKLNPYSYFVMNITIE
jgi:hypothetical protein